MPIRMTHWSAKPLGDFIPQPDQTKPSVGNGKPRGLWLSDDSDHGWKTWCEGEEWGLGGLIHRAEFDVDPTRVHLIRSDQELLAFNARFGVSGEHRWYHGIDWSAAASEKSGIVITPYLWKMRLDDRVGWYYGWDCASGCIWGADAIVRVSEAVA